MTPSPAVEMSARARGLASRLLRRADLEALAALDAPALARALARDGHWEEPLPDAASACAIDAAARRAAALRVGILRAWGQGRDAVLDVFDAEQDRRSLRSLLRGALAGAPAESRLLGLVPTQRLPQRALAELARRPTPLAVVKELVLLSHPVATALLPLAARAQPEAFAIELVLLRHAAAQERRSARGGDANLRAVVERGIDVSNMATALVAAASPAAPAPAHDDPASWFVEGGRSLSRADFVAACGERTPVAAATRLEAALAGSALAAVAREALGGAGRVERAALTFELGVQRRAARLDPLGSGTLLELLLRLDAQSRDLGRIAWGATLGAPAAVIRAELVTPWD